MFTDHGPQRHRNTEHFRFGNVIRPLSALCFCVAVACHGWLSPGLVAQQLIDRIIARIGMTVVTMTDVNAAIAFGVVAGDDFELAAEQMIQRQLLLNEVARFAPPDPGPGEIDRVVDQMKARAGDRLPQVMESTGVTDERLREMARDTLRIQAYILQRFGPPEQRRPNEVEDWIRDLRARATVSVPSQAD